MSNLDFKTFLQKHGPYMGYRMITWITDASEVQAIEVMANYDQDLSCSVIDHLLYIQDPRHLATHPTTEPIYFCIDPLTQSPQNNTISTMRMSFKELMDCDAAVGSSPLLSQYDLISTDAENKEAIKRAQEQLDTFFKKKKSSKQAAKLIKGFSRLGKTEMTYLEHMFDRQ